MGEKEVGMAKVEVEKRSSFWYDVGYSYIVFRHTSTVHPLSYYYMYVHCMY